MLSLWFRLTSPRTVAVELAHAVRADLLRCLTVSIQSAREESSLTDIMRRAVPLDARSVGMDPYFVQCSACLRSGAQASVLARG